MLNINVSNPKAFVAAINTAVKFADTREHNSLPTRNIMVETTDNGLVLTATDLENAVEFGVNSSEVISEGEFCIPATSLKKLGEIVKDQSAIGLEATKSGVNLTLSDAPNFVAKFKTSETDEFPMLPKPDPKAHWIEFDAVHIATIKALAKYASAEKYRVGYDALQFAMHDDDNLLAYTTDGESLAYAKLGRTRIPNFAIPVEAVKKALSVANTPELKKSAWRVTLPTDDSDVTTIQITESVVKFKAGDAMDVTDWILKRLTHHDANNHYLAFEPKALTDGLKKVSKHFSKDRKHFNVVIIEGNEVGNITMTAEVYNKSLYSYYPVDMDTEYTHEFTPAEANRVMGDGDFRIVVDGKKFVNMVKDLSVSKPKFIQVAAHYAVEESETDPNSDTVVVTGTDLPLGFITKEKGSQMWRD